MGTWKSLIGSTGGKVTSYPSPYNPPGDPIPPDAMEFSVPANAVGSRVEFEVAAPFDPGTTLSYGGVTWNILNRKAYRLRPLVDPIGANCAVFIGVANPADTVVFGSNNLTDPSGWHPLDLTDPSGWTPTPQACRPVDPARQQGGLVPGPRMLYTFYVLARRA
jgi:hypothetical protein